MESPVSTNELKGSLDDIMDEEDWALIFDQSGRLKGIFIPEGKKEDDVPLPIVELLKLFDTSLDDAEDATIH